MANKTNCIKLDEVPGVQLTVTPSCFQWDTKITISVFYADPPYVKGLDSECIQMAPIVRLQCNDKSGQQTTRFPFSLQIPVPLAQEACQYLSVAKIYELPVQIMHRRHEPDSQWEVLDSKFAYFIDDNSCPCINFNMHYFADVTFVLEGVLSVMQQVSQYIFPSYQQEIRLWAYVTVPMKESTKVTLKLILAKAGLENINILDSLKNNPNYIQLEASGLEDVFIANGSYRLRFVSVFSSCVLLEDYPFYTAFDWNNRNYFAFDIKCRLKNLASNHGNLGKLCIFLAKEDRPLQECSLTMVIQISLNLNNLRCNSMMNKMKL